MENTPRRQAFLAMYHCLDDMYSNYPYHNLAVVLSDINPNLFVGSMSADPAAWEDFCDCYKNAEGAYSGELDTAYYAVLQYLRTFDEEWGYPIPYVFEHLTPSEYRKYYLHIAE